MVLKKFYVLSRVMVQVLSSSFVSSAARDQWFISKTFLYFHVTWHVVKL